MSNIRNKKITNCRVCKNKNLTEVFSLGKQSLTGVFPLNDKQNITQVEMTLVKCDIETGCGLVQLKWQ